MLVNFIEQASNNLLSRVLPPARRYFLYAFLILGVIWLTVANYYFFSGEVNKFCGALISGVISFTLALIIVLYDRYMKGKEVKTLQVSKKEDMLKTFVMDNYPLLWNLGANKLKNIILNLSFSRLIKFGLISSILYFTSAFFKNHKR